MDNYIPYFKYERQKPTSRFTLFQNLLNGNPNLFHKKKSIFNSDIDNYKGEPNKEENDELLFQDENEYQINKFKTNIINKSSVIESNTKNYLKYLSRSNRSHKKTYLKPINLSFEKSNIKSCVNTPMKLCNDRYDEKTSINRLLKRKNIFPTINTEENSEEDNNYLYQNINVGKDYSKRKNFLPSIYNMKGTDITNPYYYDKIANQLLKMKNKEISDYNQSISENKLNFNNKIFVQKENEITLPPGHVSNPKYYNLGESRLKNNIIINPGNHCISPCINSNNFHKLKSIFI